MSYDFLSGENIRVEVKSSCLRWVKSSSVFRLNFNGIKQDNDEVRLITYIPSGVYMHKWNGAFMHKSGKYQDLNGISIKIDARVHTLCWEEAIEKIFKKDWGTEICKASWKEFNNAIQFEPSPSSKIYAGAPLADLTSYSRAKVLSQWVRNFDSNTMNAARQKYQCETPRNYLREGIRVNVRMAQMQFDTFHNYWYFQFQHVSPLNYDELRLVFYTPEGIYVYIHDGHSGFSKSGRYTIIQGKMRIFFAAPRNVEDWKCALALILKKQIGTLLIQCPF